MHLLTQQKFQKKGTVWCSTAVQLVVSSVIKNPASFFLYRLYLWADKRLPPPRPPRKHLLLQAQKTFLRSLPRPLPLMFHSAELGHRLMTESAPGQRDGATSLAPTKQDLRLELGERWASLGSQSQGREKGAGVG